jgi:hypothetical protein
MYRYLPILYALAMLHLAASGIRSESPPTDRLYIFNPNVSPSPGLVRVMDWDATASGSNTTGEAVTVAGWPQAAWCCQVFATSDPCTVGAFTHDPSFVSIDFCTHQTPTAVKAVALPLLLHGSWHPAYASTKAAFDAVTGYLYVYTYTEYPYGQYGADFIVAVDTNTGSLVFNTSLPALGATDSSIALAGPTGGMRRLYVNLNGNPNKAEPHLLLTIDPATGRTLHRQTIPGQHGYFQALFASGDTVGSLIALGAAAFTPGWHLHSYRVAPDDGAVSPLSDLMVDQQIAVACSGLNLTSNSATILQYMDSTLGYAARFVGMSLNSGTVQYSSTGVAGGVFDGAVDGCALVAW